MDGYPYDLGRYSLRVTTTSPEAQLWFDRGLNWTYGYNHDEAVACFRRATEADPTCAMAWWGIAYATGPNYNMPWKMFDPKSKARALATAHDATTRAMALIDSVTAPEAALIAALPARYPQAEPLKRQDAWDLAFTDAMRAAIAAHPEELDLRAIYVESLLVLTPWKMWDLATAAPAEDACTVEAQDALEAVLSTPEALRHPGILHLYIHLMEMSPTPEKALRAADALRDLVPDAGHLVHMATHIDVLCGEYRDTVYWNQHASRADRKYYDREGAFNLYSGYRLHNYHFAIYGAMFLGQMAPAMQAVRDMADTVPQAMLEMESPPMADFFESYLAMEPHVLIRFGKWRECTELELPENQSLRSVLTALTYYARSLGHAALGEVDRALEQEQHFLRAAELVSDKRRLHNNRVVDLLAIAREMLRGEIEYRIGNFEVAFDHLRASVALDDALPYDEPWGWMQPARHALGALLFEQGQVAEAEAVFREDLGLGGTLARASIHPDNVWALKGLHDCLEARGETVERPHIKMKLDRAMARADRVAASCACAQVAMEPSCCG